jgi:DNA-binding response OmpR family regulator
MRILVVEDDFRLADLVRRALREQTYNVDVAHDGEAALFLVESEDFQLIILDLMIPKIDGITVCRKLRSSGATTPIIMLTARDTVDDRILGLDAGADDYLVKPFAVGELLARVRAVLRRAEHLCSELLHVGPLTLDSRSGFVKYGQREIVLTPKEFALMHFLMQHPGQIVTRTELLQNVWDSNYDGLSNVVDVYINYLRNKLEENGEPRIIETVRGRGYMLAEGTDGT